MRSKMELSVPLLRMRTGAKHEIPSALLLVAQGLEAAAMDFAYGIAQQPSMQSWAGEDLLKDIGRRSVFRIWRYDAGVGCRPHYDPGICTALLKASAGGLEFGKYPCRSHGNDENTLLQPDWFPPQLPVDTADTMVLAGNMTGLLSRGAIPAVLHRVRSDWADHADSKRYSLVVELRPAEPNRWYKLFGHCSVAHGCVPLRGCG
ncbi:hypothetical protein, conserved [Trypanosoma brucei gambiense DAL972]|uniref:Fe2OG dioxygenase domain-containing protein n=1 Tax=Trypanosoma brucei gambiense (strain MHOM/CI/86/DAL972) TaxID=679716 RepID=C9ZXR4_TRYB9|nr:hypothetical protein, conserved [Trypanosoma brucei gambiense DAL972]CBH14209.1 hypothetical protein, conserved [Trypanosoma brucei gambiense DAL972]|eukprot:XP_011776479.1 hypothetical protein, conserved [Trypanosoma brucei gambiense DAL972]